MKEQNFNLTHKLEDFASNTLLFGVDLDKLGERVFDPGFSFVSIQEDSMKTQKDITRKKPMYMELSLFVLLQIYRCLQSYIYLIRTLVSIMTIWFSLKTYGHIQ